MTKIDPVNEADGLRDLLGLYADDMVRDVPRSERVAPTEDEERAWQASAKESPEIAHLLAERDFWRFNVGAARYGAEHWRKRAEVAASGSVKLTDTVSTYTDEAGNRVTFHGVRGSYTPK